MCIRDSINDVSEIDAIGHRVVHGGEKFKSSCLITDEVINTLREPVSYTHLDVYKRQSEGCAPVPASLLSRTASSRFSGTAVT